jgi:hypothetical protein
MGVTGSLQLAMIAHTVRTVHSILYTCTPQTTPSSLTLYHAGTRVDHAQQFGTTPSSTIVVFAKPKATCTTCMRLNTYKSSTECISHLNTSNAQSTLALYHGGTRVDHAQQVWHDTQQHLNSENA